MKKQSKTARPFSTAGERLDDMLGDTTKRIEEETQALIAYINDELVPAIRDHSSKALRIASEKMAEAAEMMESATRRKKQLSFPTDGPRCAEPGPAAAKAASSGGS